ncbi:alpha/beta hydrolase family esterase [Streptomyces vinaceus]|uniref:alpha/beta hydrolase family esterase n=1 Tax=Streptomyces vinaceus TaxID=1960 RepID=UPI00369BD8EA
MSQNSLRTVPRTRLRPVLLGLLCLGALLAGPPPAPAAAGPSTAGSPSGCATMPRIAPGRTAPQTLTSGGRRREYLLHVPAGYRPDRPSPVVLAFHGAGQSAELMESYSALSTLDALVLYPQGTTGTNGSASWEGAPYSSGADDVRFVGDLLERTRAWYCVDSKRVYATGKSNGGGFTALLACRMPNRIAAFAPVAGAYYPQTAKDCGSAPAAPVLSFHGTADTVIKYDGGTGHGTTYPSVPAWLAGWAEKDGCRVESGRGIGPDVTVSEWTDCSGGGRRSPTTGSTAAGTPGPERWNAAAPAPLPGRSRPPP